MFTFTGRNAYEEYDQFVLLYHCRRAIHSLSPRMRQQHIWHGNYLHTDDLTGNKNIAGFRDRPLLHRRTIGALNDATRSNESITYGYIIRVFSKCHSRCTRCEPLNQ